MLRNCDTYHSDVYQNLYIKKNAYTFVNNRTLKGERFMILQII